MHKANERAYRREFVLFDDDNPRSIARLLPPALVQVIQSLYKSEDLRKLFGLPEHRLWGELFRRSWKPTNMDQRIRVQFWLEFERVQAIPKLGTREKKMDMSYVIGFCISKEAFYDEYIHNPYAVIWMMCPPVNYVNAIEEVLRASTYKLQEIIEAVDPHSASSAMANFIHKTNLELHRRIKTLGNSTEGIDDEGVDEPETEEPTKDEKAEQEKAAEKAREEKKKRIEELRKSVAETQAKNNAPPPEPKGE